MKKIITLLLCVIMILSISVITTNALTEGDWEYKIIDNEIIITGYNGSAETIVMPSTIRGCPVVKTEYRCMGIFPTVKNLTLPETLREIGDGSFEDCKLETINIPKSVEVIGNVAFKKCKQLRSIDLSHLPNLKELGTGIFSECYNLTDVILPNNLTHIPKSCFSSCSSLQHITIPSSVTHIMSYAFYGCGLEGTLVLPSNIKEIHAEAFGRNYNLKEVVVPYGATFVSGLEFGSNVINDKWGRSPFYECFALEALYLPDTVQHMSHKITAYDPNCIVYVSENFPHINILKENEISYIIDNSVNTKINVLYNGNRISFHKYEQNPDLINGRTMVPLRSIFEAMGASVDWDNNTQTAIAKKGSTTVKIQINSSTMYVNGTAKTLDVPASLMNNRTMVPVRAISEAFGCKVDWDQNTYTVLITQ